MLWTGPWDLSSINSDVSVRRHLLPGYQGNHETIAGPDLYVIFDHVVGAVGRGVLTFVTWLTSAPVHLQFAIATGDLPIRKSETKLPGYQTFLDKYPAEKVFVDNLNNVKHVRPNIADYPQVSIGPRDHGAVRAARPGHSRPGAQPGVDGCRLGLGRP